MTRIRIMLATLGFAAVAGCAASTPPATGPTPESAPASPAPATQVGIPSLKHSPADVKFMNDMIAHHAQAVRIAGWAPTHGASPAVQRMAERVVVGQNDEIAIMQRWLRERKEPVPEADSAHQMHHGAHMPGMLSPAELEQLDKARGAGFDRLFLTFMIRHHQGALTMVDQLFGSQGAAQDETVFRLASDVYADQSTEIERMQRMIEALPPERNQQ